MKVVIDTNVPVVANGKSQQASPQCVINCANRLNEVKQKGKIILDDKWLILREYMKNLRSRGEPGVGDAFLKWVLTNHRNPQRCDKVSITPKNSDQTDFVEFPSDPALAGFDRDDRKFVAVALAHLDRPPVLQAVDVEWWQMRDFLYRANVRVDFLCQDDIQRLINQ